VRQANHINIAIGIGCPAAENGLVALPDVSQGLPGQWQSFVQGTDESPIGKPRIHRLHTGVVVLQAWVSEVGPTRPRRSRCRRSPCRSRTPSGESETYFVAGADIDDGIGFVGTDVARQRLRGKTSYEEARHRCTPSSLILVFIGVAPFSGSFRQSRGDTGFPAHFSACAG